MAYDAWRKSGELMTPTRVVGLAVERLWEAEVARDMSRVRADDCSTVALWGAQCLENGRWARPRTCVVPLRAMHMDLAYRIWQRVDLLLHGLGLAVVDAVRNKTRGEGTGQHDLVLKHCGVQRYCSGFLSAEVKVGQVEADGRAFEACWRCVQSKTADALKSVLRCRGSPYGAALLIFVGVCDSADLAAKDPPLLVRAQLMVVKASGIITWADRVLDRTPPAAALPPAKRQRRGATWDEVRAAMRGHSQNFGGGTEYVPLARLFVALGSGCKSPGQKMKTYIKEFGFKLGTDFVRKRSPTSTRGGLPYWVTWAAAEQIANYEHGR